MKKLLLFPLIFIAFFAKSQTTPYIPYYDLGEPWQFQKFDFYGDNYEKIQDSLIDLHKIKTRKTFAKNKKGEQVLITKNLYNGKESSFEAYNLSQRKTNYKSYYKINNYRIYEWKNWGTRQKQLNEYITINDKEYLKETSHFKKDKLTSRSLYYWNQDGILDSMQFYGKRETTASISTHYAYKNNKLAETRTYEKGKLTAVRKYDCTPLGEVQKKVSQSTQCVNTEFDAEGNKITITEYTDEKGRVRKWKITYVGDSKVVLRNEGFDYKNRPTYFTETTPEKRTTINYKTWGINKGKESYKRVIHYDINKKLVKNERFNNGKLQSIVLYKYDNKGQILSQSWLDKKGKEYSKLSFEYDNQGLKTKQTKSYKKKTYIRTYKYE